MEAHVSNLRFSSDRHEKNRNAPKGITILWWQLSNLYPNHSHHQARAQRKRVAAEKEEQRRECALTFEKSRSKRYRACSDVVPVTGQLRIVRLSQSAVAEARLLGGSRIEPPVLVRPSRKKSQCPQRASRFFGAGDRTRTGTQKPARDFKSLVSTIPPHRLVHGHFSTYFRQRQENQRWFCSVF